MRRIDLHTHSTYSDGTLPPAEVARRAHAQGVELYALTDHDTVDGIPEARAEAERLGMRYVHGIEINCALVDSVHILGLGIDPDSPVLRENLEAWRGRRAVRAAKMIEKLQGLGIDVTMDDVASVSRQSIGRPHIADALIRKKVVRKRNDAFQKYLMHGRPAYVEPMGASPAEAIAAIKAAGGVPVLAHPHQIGNALDLDAWQGLGLGGLEAYYLKMTGPKREKFLAEAAARGLMVSGGSDYHGPETGRETAGGVEVPDAVFERLAALA